MSSGATVVDMTLSDEARALGTEARQRKAVERAADLAPIISELRTSGVTSLSGIAAVLTERGIPTARGGSSWTAVQVRRVLAQIALNFGLHAIPEFGRREAVLKRSRKQLAHNTVERS